MSDSTYPAFPSIPRLNREITITEKIDGTNGLISIDPDTLEVRAGSRNRWLQPGKQTDNFGFARWVDVNAAELQEVLGPGDHYGEWWGRGIQRGYDQEGKKFSLFNSGRWDPQLLPPLLRVVPILWQGQFDSQNINTVLGGLHIDGSMAAPGYMNPEGIVIFHHHARTLSKVTLGGDGHKQTVKR